MQAGKVLLVTLIVGILSVSLQYYRLAVGVPPCETAPARPPAEVSDAAREAAVQRLAEFLRFKTVSSLDAGDHMADAEPFAHARAHLEASYPAVWDALEVEVVNGESLLFTWRGELAAQRPILFISHYDVVPVNEGTEGAWTWPPFSGAVQDGFVWGRGAIDVKFTVIAMLEAVTHLLASGFQPQRTLLFAFGHDEEVRGTLGARRIAETLRSRGIVPEVIIDEGGAVMTDGLSPITTNPIAVVATAEKGGAQLDITVAGSGGHSSMPPIDGSSTASILGRIVTALDASPPPAVLAPPITDFLRKLAPMAHPAARPFLYHCESGVARKLLAAVLARVGPDTAAMVRSTLAVIRLEMGVADNVLAGSGSLRVNARLLPGEGAEEARAMLASLAEKEAGVSVDIIPRSDGAKEAPASPVSPPEGAAWDAVASTIEETFSTEDSQVVVVPYLWMGGTDSANYQDLDPEGKPIPTYRFMPINLKRKGDVQRIHGVDERIAIEDVRLSIVYFMRLIQKIHRI